ncbi:MAG: phosphohydrolase, partial [Gaiellaceae bacterium]
TSDRSYRKALSQEVAIAELRGGSGTQFDPQVVDALIAALSG